MKVLMRGVHLTLNDSLKAYLEEHLVTRMERFYDNEAAELDIQLVDNNGPKGGNDKECRVTAFIPGMSPLHVTEVAASLREAIDLCRDRLERTAKRELSKRREVTGHRVSRPASRFAPSEPTEETGTKEG